VRRPLVPIAAAVVVLAGLAAVPATAARPAASTFIKGVVRQIVRNDYAHAWLSLHPAQQQLVPKDDYVRCEEQSPVAGRLVWIKVVRVADARFKVGGVKGRVAGKAVTVRIKLADDVAGDTVVVTHTAHAVWVGGSWRWILPAERIGIYGSTACKTGTPGP
jgi:hypothetical protein